MVIPRNRKKVSRTRRERAKAGRRRRCGKRGRQRRSRQGSVGVSGGEEVTMAFG